MKHHELEQISSNTGQTERQSGRANFPGWLSRSLFLILVGSGLIALTLAFIPRLQFFIENVNRWLNYPYFQAGSEGLVLSEAAIVKAGGSLYVPLRPDLFISAPYPPLYYYLLAWLWPSGSDASAGFSSGRIISLVSALLSALFIALLVLAESKARTKVSYWWAGLAGLLAGLTFLSMPAVTVWAVRVRADMLMVAFQILGLALIAWKPRSWPAFVAILPLTLALYTKHTGLAAPLAATVFMIIQNWPNWKRVLTWGLGLAGAIGVPFIILNLLTNLEFYRRLFPYHDLGKDDRNFERYISLFWQENAALLISGLLLLILLFQVTGIKEKSEVGSIKSELTCNPVPSNNQQLTTNNFAATRNSVPPTTANRQPTTFKDFPLSGWFLLFSLPLLLGLGVVGTDHNHFLPGEAAGCAVAGVLCARSFRGFLELSNKYQVSSIKEKSEVGSIKSEINQPETRNFLPTQNSKLATRNSQLFFLLPLLALALLWVQVAVCAVPDPRYEIEFRARPADYQRQLGQIVKAAADQSGPILTSEAAFLALTNRSADNYYYNDMFTINALARKGTYKLDGMLQAVRERKFGIILAEGDFFSGERIRADVWPLELIEAIKQNYQLKFKDIWFTYEPKS